MPSNATHHYSSSSSSSRSSASSTSAAALAEELSRMSLGQQKAPSYDTKLSSRLQPKYAEPKRTSRQTSSSYDTSLTTPESSRSRTKSSYGDPVIRDKREVCRDERRSKTNDSRYHENSFLDSSASYSKSSSKNDSRFHQNSSYYQGRRS